MTLPLIAKLAAISRLIEPSSNPTLLHAVSNSRFTDSASFESLRHVHNSNNIIFNIADSQPPKRATETIMKAYLAHYTASFNCNARKIKPLLGSSESKILLPLITHTKALGLTETEIRSNERCLVSKKRAQRPSSQRSLGLLILLKHHLTLTQDR